MTERGGGASLLPYTPAGMMGSDDDETILLLPMLEILNMHTDVNVCNCLWGLYEYLS